MTKTGLFALPVAMLIATSAWAHDYTVGDLVIAHPFSFETAKTARIGAGYFEVTNNGDTEDTLVAISADFPRVMIHQSVMNGDVMEMEHAADGIVIAPGETLLFAPGGYHVMFMGLDGGFTTGDAFDATLTFENAGEIVVTFKVEDRAEGAVDHSNHGN